MTKQKVTIEIEIPDGWEFVRYGHPNEGEHFVYGNEVSVAYFTFEKDKCVIVRKVNPPYEYPFPDWVKDGVWLAVNADGESCVFENEPRHEHGYNPNAWDADSGYYEFIKSMSKITCDFPIPVYTDWKHAKWQKKPKGK